MTAPNGQQSSLVLLQALLQQWGLSSLNQTVQDMLTAGDSADVIPIKLRQTDAYKQRFAGNLERVKNGLPALSEAEYLSTETALKDVVRRYVGSGVYDTNDNVAKWMSVDLSPQELNDRMGLYADRYQSQPQEVKDAWADHGLTPQDALKSMMDPTLDEGTLRRQSSIYALGAQSVSALHNDSALNVDRLGQLVDRGVQVNDQSAKAFQDVAARTQYEGFLGRTAGVDLTLNDQEDAALLDDAQAEKKRQKVLNTDKARFNENYMGGTNLLNKSSAGSY